MKSSTRVDNRVVGLGSPHGDDQIGWRAVELLRTRPFPGTVYATVRVAIELAECLQGCRRALLIDASESGAAPGTITRLEWPDPRIAQPRQRSTHGVGVGGALALAERLGRLPPQVVVYGVEITQCQPGAALSPALEAVLMELVQRVRRELQPVSAVT